MECKQCWTYDKLYKPAHTADRSSRLTFPPLVGKRAESLCLRSFLWQVLTDDKQLTVQPNPLLTCLQGSLAEAANLGATSAISLISSLGLNDTLESCRGCTFLIPVNDAFASADSMLANLTTEQKTNILFNHVSRE